MPIDFPDSPSVGDVFTIGTKQWMWDGTTWSSVASATLINNVDGGNPSSVYGGINSIDGGGV